MRPLLPAVAALALALSVTGAAQAAPLKIDVATQQRLGIVTAPLVAARRSATISGFARALDAVPLATLDADIAAAAAALIASKAEAARATALNAADQTVSKQAAQAAQAQARGDAAKLLLLRRRLGMEWGTGVASMSDARRGQLIAALASGRAALVRVDAATGLSGQRGTVSIDLGPAGAARAVILGTARTGDPRLQSTGVLALISGPKAMNFGAGAVAPASLALGAGAQGVILPRAALLRTGGQAYAYVRHDAGSFERRPVNGAVSDPAGLFTASGFTPGEAVVTAGAAQLFAAETPAPKGD
jgi:hypothetical protein